MTMGPEAQAALDEVLAREDPTIIGVVLNRVRAASVANQPVAEQSADRPAGGSQEEAQAPPGRRTTVIRARRSVRPATDS